MSAYGKPALSGRAQIRNEAGCGLNQQELPAPQKLSAIAAAPPWSGDLQGHMRHVQNIPGQRVAALDLQPGQHVLQVPDRCTIQLELSDTELVYVIGKTVTPSDSFSITRNHPDAACWPHNPLHRQRSYNPRHRRNLAEGFHKRLSTLADCGSHIRCLLT